MVMSPAGICSRCKKETVGRLRQWHALFVWSDDNSAPRHLAYYAYPNRTWWQRTIGPSGRFAGRPILDICMECGKMEIAISDAKETPWELVEYARLLADGSRHCAACSGTQLVILDQVFNNQCLHIAGVTIRSVFLPSSAPAGKVGAVICRDCGYVDLRLVDLDSIPWSRLEGFDWLETPQPCPRCNGTRIGQLAHAGDPSAMIALSRKGRLLEGVGRLCTRLCPGCGFIDVFVKSPKTVPWDTLIGFERPS